MATRKTRGNDTYLHQPTGGGGTWYARVIVPRTLRKFIGQTHIRRSLHTTSKTEANLRKHAVVGQIKAQFAELRRKPPTEGTPGASLADAREFYQGLRQLRAAGDYDQAETVEMVAVDHATKLEGLYGSKKAHLWYRMATNSADTLRELMDRWLGSRDFKESTKMGHRKALAEVLSFLEDEDALPADVTPEKALAYIDNVLMKSGLAANTMRDRLVSLGGFWSWMATRNVVPRSENPWKGHHISKKQHKGTRPPKRQGGFTDAELLRLLAGNERVKSWETAAYLPDLAVLGMFTGARLESLAAMTFDRVEKHKGGYVLRMENDKTDAGTRPVGVTHPAAVAVIKRRTKGLTGSALLFSELRQGGADSKWSASATKAFGRYRRACDVPDGTDFHSFRRLVAGTLEGAGMNQADIARFLGHKVGTLAADTYAGPRAAEWALEAARKVRYSKAVEAAAVEAIRQR